MPTLFGFVKLYDYRWRENNEYKVFKFGTFSADYSLFVGL